jgi:hypothetical protein
LWLTERVDPIELTAKRWCCEIERFAGFAALKPVLLAQHRAIGG